jgi:hypothetical protein
MGLSDLSLGPTRCKLERNMFFFSDYWHMELLIILRFHLCFLGARSIIDVPWKMGIHRSLICCWSSEVCSFCAWHAFFGVKITIPTYPNIWYLQETGWHVNRMGPGKMIHGQASFVDRMGANLYICVPVVFGWFPYIQTSMDPETKHF